MGFVSRDAKTIGSTWMQKDALSCWFNIKSNGQWIQRYSGFRQSFIDMSFRKKELHKVTWINLFQRFEQLGCECNVEFQHN